MLIFSERLSVLEIRDPVHGFIKITDWERDIINHPLFQRLRRIKQLSGTDMLYPGASHTRFEHSLGVMHVASQFFDAILSKKKNKDILISEKKFNEAGFERERVFLRLACLLHDVGHSPYSHSGAELMPINDGNGEKYDHEDYTVAAVRKLFKDLIDDHKANQNYEIKADRIADFIEGSSKCGRIIFWREILSGNLDADRCDYLLRDSHHSGVGYGKFDIDRFKHTLTIATDESHEPRIAVEEGGYHAAEGLLIARYMMFTQVYFHKTRRSYDHHIQNAIKKLLNDGYLSDKSGHFPKPDSNNNLSDYFKWDDWLVNGAIQKGLAGTDGDILMTRGHDRCVWYTPENPNVDDLREFKTNIKKLDSMVTFDDSYANAWYKFSYDIDIVPDDLDQPNRTVALSELSNIIKGLKGVNQYRIYVSKEDRDKAIRLLNSE